MAATYLPIATQTADGTSTTLTFSSIPSTYDHLVLRGSARSTAATTYTSFSIRFNSDTGSNYYGGGIYFESSVNGGSASASGSLTFGGIMYIPGANSSTNTFSANEITIFNYKTSSYKKTSGGLSASPSATGANDSGIGYGGGIWNSTSAITTITLTTSSGNFANGSTFRLYGISNS